MVFATNLTAPVQESLFYEHRYKCTPFEQFLMVLITAISNFASIPAIILLLRKRNFFAGFMALFTEITSFMYHFMESIALKKFMNMDEYQWHKLDNIGSISCFMALAVFLADTRNQDLDLILDYIALIVTLILQESDPWNILNTVSPIILYFLLIPIFSIQRKRLPSYNRKMSRKGYVCLLAAIACFSLALDEFNDYLRFFHGCWHFFVGASSFYLAQVKVPEGHETTFATLFSKKVYVDGHYNID